MAIEQGRVHFIGIGGYGMSALARVLLDRGVPVSGSDVASKALTEQLAARGARVYIGHDATHIDGAVRVVYSTDIPKDNVELVAAREKGIELLHRSQLLAELLNAGQGIAVSGAHGKTTTSSMIAFVMEKAGWDPTYVIGGEVVGLDGNAKAGRSPYVVAEADESDGSFLHYTPQVAVVTNIEPDHLEHYGGDFERLKGAYRQFLRQVRPDGFAVLCVDCANLRSMIEAVPARVVTYGLHTPADYTAVDVETGDRRIAFTAVRRGETLGRVTVAVPGVHNVANALACLAVCLELGMPFDVVARHLGAFRGAKRRFQVMGEAGGVLVVDDYAHHSTEIQATLRAAKDTGRRVIAVFQPQRYTRTALLLDEFSRAFGEADEVIIADIYSPAGETPIPGVSSERLVDLIRERSNPRAVYIPDHAGIVAELLRRVREGDLVLTMGAGDIWKVAEALVGQLQGKKAPQKP